MIRMTSIQQLLDRLIRLYGCGSLVHGCRYVVHDVVGQEADPRHRSVSHREKIARNPYPTRLLDQMKMLPGSI